MRTTLAFGIREYRATAAQRFLTARASRTNPISENSGERSNAKAQLAPYRRAHVPGLDEYLRDAALAYARAKTSVKRNQLRLRQLLGHGKLVTHLYAAVRRERWCRARAENKHFGRVAYKSPVLDIVFPCGIPRDVLQTAASAFSLQKSLGQVASRKSESVGNILGWARGNEGNGIRGIRLHPDFGIHVEHCESVLLSGGSAISTKTVTVTRIGNDRFEDVHKRYAGRPDELYRRKTARRYATWRRRRREEERTLHEQEMNAEREMKRRRGHDQLLTSRPTGDASFAPFLYDLSNNTYAYSSKITEAPKLREVMVDKYSGSIIENKPGPSQWQKAHQVAETNPLFHTKVMNRFS